ncbi:hypothetical protein B7463_g9525, partial [Scytalidium lignicola]
MSESYSELPPHINRSVSLIPVGLKEAALDSPTFRASAVHFSDQVEVIEKWLDAYVKSITKLVHDVSLLEETFNTFVLKSVPPSNISEAVLDHDYTLLAMKRLGDGSKEWLSHVIYGMKKMEANIIEPIKSFMGAELRNFKDARRYLEQSQKVFDNTLARYVSQSKTKEPSALREDAFQVHETRKAYLKASLDFCLLAPQLRYTLDKLLVRVSSDQWRDMKKSRDAGENSFSKWGNEMDRVRGWSKEIEASESVFRRELQIARREIADEAAQVTKPSRELEDYNSSTVAFLGSKGPSTVNVQLQGRLNVGKQGWLFLRTMSGKPARTIWVRRWFYVKNGIFGWLVQGAQSGGVEESEKIGVLLCNVKPAVQEDRRFCFEVKTKNQAVLLQAETQGQLMEWLEAFEIAKNRALDASAKDSRSLIGAVDPAFAITPPSVPEFAVKPADGHSGHGSEDFIEGGMNNTGSLSVAHAETANLASRSSFDITAPRRSVTSREEGERTRDHAARIMQKLDLHRKSTAVQPDTPTSVSSGGIASLISASHNIIPHSTPTITQAATIAPKFQLMQPHLMETGSTLAPSTLANPPAPTNLSKAAVIVGGERGIRISGGDATGGMPSGIMANLWGSSNWGYINRLEKESQNTPNRSLQPSPKLKGDENLGPDASSPDPAPLSISTGADVNPNPLPNHVLHRKALSVDADARHPQIQIAAEPESFPNNYPLELRMQEAQFRMLFPNVPIDQKLLLVFRATWNPNNQQEFPGRVYVTQHDFYFYSHHLGLVLTTGVGMDTISEVTAAPGKDCDFLFLHLREDATFGGYTRITIKTFLEPLRLLQRRLNYLVDVSQAEEPEDFETTMATLIRMENEDPSRSPSMESWENIPVTTPFDNDITKFKLPSEPVDYEPQDMQRKSVERVFNISPKALFHVMFGDKSAVFQLLYHERRAQQISQGPWINTDDDRMRREFHFQINYTDVFRRTRKVDVADHQIIDILNDHVCYVITDYQTPWHLPHQDDFMLVSKAVITYVAKSKCKLAIYSRVDWSKIPAFSKGLVERQALDDCEHDAEELADLVTDQVRSLGAQSKTKKAIHIFGPIGQKTSVTIFTPTDSSLSKKRLVKQRQRTLTHMLWEIVASFAESAISSLMMWAFAFFRSIWKVLSANALIMMVLTLSVLVNVILSSKGTSAWWAERNAARFMTRIGVGPNHIMSKAIYIKDLDEAITSLSPPLSNQTESRCYMQFKDIANLTDLDESYQTAGFSFSESSARSTARRLRRSRQHLSSYRHDLLVAMRLVNSIDREVMQAEWENWLLDENIKCRQIDALLKDKTTPSPGESATKKSKGFKWSSEKKEVEAKEKEENERLESLRIWQQEYCGSCLGGGISTYYVLQDRKGSPTLGLKEIVGELVVFV